MSEATVSGRVFRYAAQTPAGEVMTGTLRAADGAVARDRLQGLGLLITELAETPPPPPHRADAGEGEGTGAGKALSGEEFLTLNRQLAELIKGGLPLERGMKLLADDAPTRRLARTIREVADELEAGTPLETAFEKHASRFPSGYGRVLGAGVRTGRLHEVLMNIAAQVQTHRAVRGAVWRAMAYPLMVIVMSILVLLVFAALIAPELREVFESFGVYLPLPTRIALSVAGAMPVVIAGLAVAAIIGFILWRRVRGTGKDQAIVEAVFWRLPWLGRVLRYDSVSRWCSALEMSIAAGLAMPEALRAAGGVSRSLALDRDSDRLASAVESGGRCSEVESLEALPASLVATLDMGASMNDLPGVLRSLTGTYEQYADQMLNMLRTAMVPVGLAILAMVVGFLILAVFLPLPTLIQGVMFG